MFLASLFTVTWHGTHRLRLLLSRRSGSSTNQRVGGLNLAPLVCMSKCPWARYWSPIAPDCCATGLWMCVWVSDEQVGTSWRSHLAVSVWMGKCWLLSGWKKRKVLYKYSPFTINRRVYMPPGTAVPTADTRLALLQIEKLSLLTPRAAAQASDGACTCARERGSLLRSYRLQCPVRLKTWHQWRFSKQLDKPRL